MRRASGLRTPRRVNSKIFSGSPASTSWFGRRLEKIGNSRPIFGTKASNGTSANDVIKEAALSSPIGPNLEDRPKDVRAVLRAVLIETVPSRDRHHLPASSSKRHARRYLSRFSVLAAQTAPYFGDIPAGTLGVGKVSDLTSQMVARFHIRPIRGGGGFRCATVPICALSKRLSDDAPISRRMATFTFRCPIRA